MKNRNGEVLRKIGETRSYFSPRLSRDAKRVAVDVSDEKGGDIWILSLDGGTAARVSFNARNETAPVWSPDGRTIAYTLDDPVGRIFSTSGGGSSALLVDLPGTFEYPADWSAKGGDLAVNRMSSYTDGDVVVWSLVNRKEIEIAATRANELGGVFSPDGKWIAYQSDETGRTDLYVQPFPPMGAKYQISAAGGSGPRWGRQDEISYIDAESHICAVKVDTSSGFSIGKPETLFPHVAGDNAMSEYDVFPDGTYLVNSIVRDRPRPMILVVKWLRRVVVKSASVPR